MTNRGRKALNKDAAGNFPFIEPMKAFRVGELPTGDWL